MLKPQDMDALFKQKLLMLRNPVAPKSFSEALLGDVSWLKKSAPKTPRPVPPKEVFSEKVQVIESLERFAVEKSVETKSPVLRLDGGEIAVKPEPSWEEVIVAGDKSALQSSLQLEDVFKQIALSQKEPGTVKALFVTEKFRNWEEVKGELQSGFINELIVGFPLKTAELFARMIGAMKLDPGEVIVFPVEGADADFAEDVMKVAAFYRPEVIITLGAKATQKILKSNDRLTLVHGQFFSRKIATIGSLQVVPLFHPSIIETNQNMKKTAWADMQKIMKHLKKLP